MSPEVISRVARICDPAAMDRVFRHWAHDVQFEGIGEPLAFLLRRRNLSVFTIATLTGLQAERIDALAHEDMAPTFPEAEAIAHTLEVPVLDLWGEEDRVPHWSDGAEDFLPTHDLPDAPGFYQPSKDAALAMGRWLLDHGYPHWTLSVCCRPKVYLSNWKYRGESPSWEAMNSAMFVLSALAGQQQTPGWFGWMWEEIAVG